MRWLLALLLCAAGCTRRPGDNAFLDAGGHGAGEPCSRDIQCALPLRCVAFVCDTPPDASVPDAGFTADSGPDAAVPEGMDAAVPDAAEPDASMDDAGMVDAGGLDSGHEDGG